MKRLIILLLLTTSLLLPLSYFLCTPSQTEVALSNPLKFSLGPLFYESDEAYQSARQTLLGPRGIELTIQAPGVQTIEMITDPKRRMITILEEWDNVSAYKDYVFWRTCAKVFDELPNTPLGTCEHGCDLSHEGVCISDVEGPRPLDTLFPELTPCSVEGALQLVSDAAAENIESRTEIILRSETQLGAL